MKILKSIFWSLDKFLLNKKILNIWSNRAINVQSKDLYKNLNHDNNFKINVYYAKDKTNLLASLCDQYGSDKGSLSNVNTIHSWPSHTYTDLYSRLFLHCRFNINTVFECGIGTNNPNLVSSMGVHGKPGASLRVWKDFFPNANIFGADIDRDILFQEERIRTYYIDQMNAGSIKEFWKKVGIDDFDIIIDDGLHTFNAGWTLFTHSIHKLSPVGTYIIEDVSPKNLIAFEKAFKATDFNVDYVTLDRPFQNLGDNNLILVRKRT